MGFLYKLKSFSFKTKFTLVASVLLIFGLMGAVFISQQQQELRSRAAGDINGDYPGDLIGDDFRVTGKVLGNVIGNRNQISNGVQGGIYGSANSIFGNVGGCINGDSNRVSGNVTGGVVGNNNIVTGTKGTGDCPLPGSSTPLPTLAPTSTPTPTPSPTPVSIPTLPPTATPTTSVGNGVTFYSDGSSSKSGPTGTVITAYAAQAAPGVTYKLVLVTNGGNASTPCAQVISEINVNNRVSNSSGLISNTAGPVNAPVGSYQVCFKEVNGTRVTAPVAFIITSSPPVTSTPSITSSPTTTIPPGSTSVALNIFLHGIGKGGDSANPSSGGNPNPLRPQRSLTFEVYNSQNQLVTTKQINISFVPSSGNFTANVDLGNVVTTGSYTMKVKTAQYLNAFIPGIQNITQGVLNQLGAVYLIVGDIDVNNQINILDYNIMMGCYSVLSPPISCTTQNNVLADLDDDGRVGAEDYNLFLRELAYAHGQ